MFTYDERSNLTSRTDARGVKTVYNYNSDPLNRLQSLSWDTTGFGDTANPILPAATVSYQYRTKSSGSQLLDIAQLSSVTTTGISTESYSYDSEGRASSKSLTLTSRASYPFVTDYIFDTLDRITDVRYPAEYGNGTQPRKLIHHSYDVASRLTGLTFDSQSFASGIVYNAASQTTSLSVGTGVNQVNESYSYNAQTGLLDNQTVVRGGTTLLNLSYDYLRAGTTSGRTGQLTKILNNLNHNKDRGYGYDALGRLVQANGGPSTAPLWTQTYAYDRYGNRTSVTASGYSAKGTQASAPADQRASLPASQRDGTSLSHWERGRGEGLATDSLPIPTSPRRSLGAFDESSLPERPSLSAQQAAEPVTPPEPADVDSNVRRSHHALRAAGTDAGRSAHSDAGAPTSAPLSVPVFTDDPLVAGVTPIKALHITELRDAINQARASASLAAASWAESVTSGVTVKASHITELRARLDEARAALGLATASYTDPGLTSGSTIKAVHVQELRDRVKEALSTPASTPVPRDGLASVAYSATTNRVTTAGFAYDAAGNQLRALIPGSSTASQRFQYDAANRLVKVKADDNVTVLASYTYGDSNERLITDESGYRTYYVSEGGAVIAEYGETPSLPTTPKWSKSYVYLGGRLLATLTPNGSGGETVQYHHPDRLGTRLVTNPASGTSFEQVTLPFGTALGAESSPDATNRRFTSYDRSAKTGLDYAVNRQYDSQQGRFNQVDPIGMKSTSLANPQTLNLYAYCTNDPINHTDPSGLGFFSWLGKLFKSIGKVISAVANAVARVLNNKWVRIGIFIATFIAPFLGPAVQAFIKAAIHLYNQIASIVGELQLAGQLLQGKFKELGLSLAMGYVGSLVATVENGIIEGLQNWIGKTPQGFIDWKQFSFKDFFHGVWEGFNTGLGDAANQLFRFRTEPGKPHKSFWAKLADILIPGYGHYCGPGIGLGAGETREPVSDLDDRCKGHDADRPALGYKKADEILFKSFFTLRSDPGLNFYRYCLRRPTIGRQ